VVIVLYSDVLLLFTVFKQEIFLNAQQHKSVFIQTLYFLWYYVAHHLPLLGYIWMFWPSCSCSCCIIGIYISDFRSSSFYLVLFTYLYG